MNRSAMQIRVDEHLWQNSMVQEGVLLAWTRADGAAVNAGEPVATVAIEGVDVQMLAPAAGKLRHSAAINAVLEPGDVIGDVETADVGREG